ncbi:MAG TPA: hypothetical protein VKA86_11260 [Candidatus Krumholzibacteria bacterium]|nr:hypothetical protein [Candidatus Krumholzibacteria bacterium]
MSMETLAEAMQRLQKSGYTEAFRVEDQRLVTASGEQTFDPTDLHVDETVRFEGESNPSDMSILFALSDPGTGVRGTWSSSFGAEMAAGDAEVVRALEGH